MLMRRQTRFKELFQLLALCLGAAVLAACSKSGQATGSTCPTGSTLTYANFGQAFVASNCLACHSNRENPNLTTQAAIQANRQEIDMVAAAGPNAVNTSMPEGGSVSAADRKLLGEWLACGAP